MMKKLILPVIGILLFCGYFSVIPQKTTILATTGYPVGEGEQCNYDYGVSVPKVFDYSKSPAVEESQVPQCNKDYPICRTEQLNLESAQVTGMDCVYENTCYCFKENFKSIKEGGSEQIVPYVKPLIENKATTTEIPDLASQINKIVNYSTGIGGIIAFLLIVFGGFQIILSGGNPERVKAGKEMITSAIAGLLLIIFAVFILKLIGADILKIPGFK